MSSPNTRPRRSLAASRLAALAWAILACALMAALWPALASSGPVDGAPEPPATPPGTPTLPTDGSEEQPDGEQPAGGSQEAGPSKMRPFPVVVIAGRRSGRVTLVNELVVRGPRGARVRLRCRGGKRCPIRKAGGLIGKRRRLRLRKAERVYRSGAVIEIRVTRPARIGKYTRIRFRRGTPARKDACLQPGETAPSRCPSE